MKTLYLKVSAAVFTLASVFAATPALAGHVLDFQVLGKGSGSDNCPAVAPLAPTIPVTDCDIILVGQASGTHIGHDGFSVTLHVDGLSQRLLNGSGFLADGLCVVLTGFGTLNPPGPSADPPTISFNVAGTVCEESGANSPLHFDGTYRITGGDNRFEGRSGGGSLTATYVRPTATVPSVVYLHLHGTIDR